MELRILEERREHTDAGSYLRGLLRSRHLSRIILAYFHRPTALFETMKLRYARRHSLRYEEVECCGTIQFPGGGAVVDAWELAECYLVGADCDVEECRLGECVDHKPFTLLTQLWVVVRKRTPPGVAIRALSTHINLPLYHRCSTTPYTTHVTGVSSLVAAAGASGVDGGGQQQQRRQRLHKYVPILDVEVDSLASERHWLLRGAKLTTFLPCME